MLRSVLTVTFLIGAVGLFSCESKEGKVEEPQAKPQVKEESVQKAGPYALADRKGCFACHDVQNKKVGPAFVDVAKRYSGKEGAVEEIVKSITKGSMGKWGSIPMTPQSVTQEEATELARWILSLK